MRPLKSECLRARGPHVLHGSRLQARVEGGYGDPYGVPVLCHVAETTHTKQTDHTTPYKKNEETYGLPD